MDSIIFGIVNSSQPLKLKQALLEKLSNAAAANESNDVCCSCLKACLAVLYPKEKSIHNATDAVLYDRIELVFKSWVENNLEFSIGFTHDFIMNTPLTKIDESRSKCLHIRMLNHILNCMNGVINDRHSLFFDNLKKYLMTEFLQIDNLELLSYFSEIFLKEFYALGTLDFDFKLQMIQLMIKLATANSFTDYDEKERKGFIIIINGGPVSTLFKKCVSMDVNLMKYAAGLIFKEISSEIHVPSTNLVPLLVNLRCDILRENLEKSLLLIPQLSVVSIALRLIDWLDIVDTDLDQWIIIVIEYLVNNGKSDVIIPAIVSKVNQMCNLIYNPKFRKQTITVLTFILMSCSETPILFHSFCLSLPPLFNHLKKDPSQSASEGLHTLAELSFTLMYKFPGYDQVYGPLLPTLDNHQKPPEGSMKAWLENFSYPVFYEESINIKNTETGIKNLGNTCYINSIIQALFNLPFFKEMLFSITFAKSSQPILMHLQKVFAFLHLSKRSFIEPRELVQISRPIWFHVGSQQDCSEYLKYLLDKLQQECCKEPYNIDDLFNGEIDAKVECLNCHSCSHQKEVFNDLPLSFRENNDNVNHSDVSQSSSLKGGNSSDLLNSKKVQFQLEEASKETVISSIDDENKTDSNLLLQTSDISIINLLNSYFSPEILKETNQYLCEVCGSLQDAYKSMKITKFPKYLVLTLKRFTFNIYTKKRSKILDVIHYPDKFKICDGCDSCYQILGPSENTVRAFTSLTECHSSKTYQISSIIVHSGLTSDSGHYYCYTCRYSSGEHKWYLMNDEEVKSVPSNCISNLALHNPRDTPYVIIYEECLPSSELSNQLTVPPHLVDMVLSDNQVYLQEKLSKRKKLQKIVVMKNHNDDKDDDNDRGSAGSCGSSGGGNDWNWGRFVC